MRDQKKVKLTFGWYDYNKGVAKLLGMISLENTAKWYQFKKHKILLEE